MCDLLAVADFLNDGLGCFRQECFVGELLGGGVEFFLCRREVFFEAFAFGVFVDGAGGVQFDDDGALAQAYFDAC